MRLLSENLHLALRRATRFALQENYCNATFCGNIHHLIHRLNCTPLRFAGSKKSVRLQWIELIRVHYRNEIILPICDYLFQNLFRVIKDNEFSLKSEFRRESYVHTQAQNTMNYLCIAQLCISAAYKESRERQKAWGNPRAYKSSRKKRKRNNHEK